MMTNQIKLTLIPDSSFLLGGVTVNPAYHSVTALDEENVPYLTATAIKGAIRIEFEAFIRGTGEVKGLCDFDQKIEGCTDCLICKLFGGGNEEGKLRFNAATIKNPNEVLPSNVWEELLAKGIRQGVSISRILGKSKDKAYFTSLTFPSMKKIKEISFTTDIDIRRKLEPNEHEYLDIFFKYIEKTGLFMGARKSVGLGYFNLRSQFPEKFEEPAPVNTSRKEKKLYKISIKTLEPLLVGNTKNKYIIDTLPFIPASTLGGTIGFGLKDYGVEDNVLNTMFNVDKSFSTFNCYLDTPFPIPLSRRSPKGKPDDIEDILIPDYIIHQAIQQNKFREVSEIFEHLYKKNLRPIHICKEPETFYNAKVAIGRRLQKSGEGLLYSMELIPKGVEFQGFVLGEEWAVEALKTKKELCMGGKRTRGFGKTIIDLVQVESGELLNREFCLDSVLREMVKEIPIQIPKDRKFFSLDFISDFTFPEEIPEGKRAFKYYFEEDLLSGIGIKIEKSFIQIIRRGGYDFKNKRVKPMMERIQAGSTILVSTPVDKEEGFLTKLKDINQNSERHKWDSTLLFRLNSPEHQEIWR